MNNSVVFIFAPQEDLTAFELWTCTRAAPSALRLQQIPPSMWRHFQLLYDKTDDDAVIVAKWFNKTRDDYVSLV